MYKIFDDIEVGLKSVTPRALLLYKGMLTEQAEKHKEIEKKEEPSIADAIESSMYAIEIFVDKAKTLEWAKTIFKMTDEQLDYFNKNFDDYNYEEFTRGFQDFLAKLSPIRMK